MDIVIGGHTFQISMVVQHLDVLGAYRGPLVVRQTMALNNQYQTKLAEESSHLLRIQDKNQSFDSRESNDNTIIYAFIC